jgi:thiol-disulfide isomerase/thioredoxin
MRRLACLLVILLATVTAVAAEGPPKTLPKGAVAPPLRIEFLDGAPVPAWSSLRGKVVVVDFWATWCAPCVGAIPHVDALKKDLAGDPVEFYSVTYEPKGKALAFLAKHPMTTRVAVDDDLTTFTSFIAWGIPIAYVVDAQGRVAGAVSPSRLTASDVRAVIAGKPLPTDPHPGWNDPAGAAKYFREQLEEDRKAYGR